VLSSGVKRDTSDVYFHDELRAGNANQYEHEYVFRFANETILKEARREGTE
jgi:hypothetical protein